MKLLLERWNNFLNEEKLYTVKSGDSLGVIASKLGVTMADIQKANGITNPDQIQIGQELKIPTSSTKKQYTDDQLLAGLLMGEAEQDGEDGMRMVYQIIKNRANLTGLSKLQVVKQPKQFSILNEQTIEQLTAKMIKRSEFYVADALKVGKKIKGIYEIALEIVKKDLGNSQVGKSTHYYNPDKENPNWAKEGEPCWVKHGKVGNHIVGKYMGDRMYGAASDGKGRCYWDRPATHPNRSSGADSKN